MIKILKKSAALLIAAVLLLCSFSVSADETIEKKSIKVLFLGNSLTYFNKMDSLIFPKICEAGGKNVEVTSVTSNGVMLCKLANEQTEIGKLAIQTIINGEFDYVILQPSRRVTPFEYSVYRAEKQAALKLNEIINSKGAKTFLFSSAGVNTGDIKVYKMLPDGINCSTDYSLAIDRQTHAKYTENLCYDFAESMTNAQVINIGAAYETLLKYYPNYNSLYKADNRHPSVRGSYLQALCIYSAIFNEDFIGKSYIYSLYPENAIIAQRAAASAVLGYDEAQLLNEQYKRELEAKLLSNNSAILKWNEPIEAVRYNIYRKEKGSGFSLIATTIGNETEYIDEQLRGAKTYTYKIKAVHKVNELEFCSEYSLASDEVVTLGVPSRVNAVLINKNTAKITLKPLKNAEKYRVFRQKEGKNSPKLLKITSKLEILDKNLKAGNTYFYWVVAEKQKGKVLSEASLSKKVVALSKPKATIVSQKRRRVNIKITPVKNAEAYLIYAKKQGERKYVLLKETEKTEVLLRKLKSKAVYDFRIKAYKGKNTKATSSEYNYYSVRVK